METSLSRLRRFPHRAGYERSEIYPILDEALMAHVGFLHGGVPVVWPTLHTRVEDKLLLHGSVGSRPVMAVRSQGHLDVCVTVTIMDGLVLARSALQHSINYRSVMLYGRLHEVRGGDRHLAALEEFTNGVLPGRWSHIRPPSVKEQKMTAVLALDIDEGAAKVRSGPPEDLPEDLDSNSWAGVIPLRLVAHPPEPHPDLREDIAEPEHVSRLAYGRFDNVPVPERAGKVRQL